MIELAAPQAVQRKVSSTPATVAGSLMCHCGTSAWHRPKPLFAKFLLRPKPLFAKIHLDHLKQNRRSRWNRVSARKFVATLG